METKKEAETFSAKTLRRLLAPAVVLLVLCLVFIAPAAASTFSGGNGNSDNPYQISSADDLKKLADLVNAGDVNYKSKFYELTTSITLNGDWMPIGNSSTNYFSGTFDGAGHTINGLSISSNTGESSEKFYGLFGYSTGTVQNLNVAGSINLNSEASISYIGGLVGYNSKTIQNCSSAVSISASGSAVIYAGGLIGYSQSGTISKNYASGTVIAENTANADVHAGGIVGYLAGGSIEECYTTSQVNAETSSGKAYAGGIVGYNPSSTISECYSTKEIRAQTASGRSYSGGIAGWNQGTIDICYATGQVTANSTAESNNFEYAGGIAGFSTGTISNSYSLNRGISGYFKNGIAGTSDPGSSNYVWERLIGEPDGTPVASTEVWNTLFGEFTTGNDWKLNTDAEFMLPVLANLPAPVNADASHLFVPSITFNANGGTGDMSAQFLKEGETSITLEKNTLEREGYSFTGWNTNADGSGEAYDDGAEISNVVDDIELYAQWQINQYTLKFVDYDCSSKVYYNQQFDFGEDLSEVSVDNPKKPGHTFAGWSENIPSTMPAHPVTIMAKWDVTKYTVSFDENGGSDVTDLTDVEYNSGIERPEDPKKHGYSFEGWYKDSALTDPWIFYVENKDLVISDTTLYANWTAWTHTINLYNYFENAVQSQANVKILTYGKDTKLQANPFGPLQGKYFGGWAKTGGGAVVYEDEEDVSSLFTADDLETTLYAVWLDTPITYRNVTFMIDGTEKYLTIKIQHGKALGLSYKPTEPTRAGYAFEGWYKESALQNALSFNGDYVVNEDTKFYAKWNPIVYYVQFNNNTGTGTMVNQDFKYGVKEALSANTFAAPSGKEFNGWNTKADGTGTSYAAGYDKSDLTTTNEETIILYAQWKSISTGNNGGTGGGGSVGGGSSAPSVKPSTPTTPTTPEVPDTPKTVTEKQEIPTGAENTVTMPTGETVFVIALDNTEVIQSVAVPEAVANANPGASVQVTEGGEAPALPEGVNADDVHIVVGVSVVDKEGNPVSVKEAGYFILEADVPKGKKLVVGHYKNDIWVDCVVEALGNGQYKVNYNGLSPFAALFIDEHEESPFAAEEQPAESPAPVLGMLLGGLAAAVILRRK